MVSALLATGQLSADTHSASQSAPRILTQVVIVGSQIIGRAFVEAYKNVSNAARANGGAAGRAADAATLRTGMSIDEAELILNVKKAGDVHAVGRDEILKRYDHLFKANDPANGGSFYLQSKIVRAKERLEMELDRHQNQQQQQ
ncbi:mitochondrial import inner membrane translocase subunit TIM16 [Entophlyctis luteolus]|nr:mitochondrial import inner membrane translocase subunit TIM16 [Entophlyctis luteolus]KAJ3206334.1 mitochondrial import inner membrane translocase subunit TIM16 [Entophlyctis luteolus]KAJ3354355.1 mitochondrial import inner membrane translocase subunit TIM16 [Entophlyctis luteolus]KAJ3379171.1 mitochondrial import inner membrane translocase subunit TIM16 [Entophlyctis sp. JEL0112]